MPNSVTWLVLLAAILYLMLITAFGRGPQTIITSLAIGTLFGGHRVVRSAALVERNAAYMHAARSVGAVTVQPSACNRTTASRRSIGSVISM